MSTRSIEHHGPWLQSEQLEDLLGLAVARLSSQPVGIEIEVVVVEDIRPRIVLPFHSYEV